MSCPLPHPSLVFESMDQRPSGLVTIFFRAGPILPVNFAAIPLNKLQTEKLREMGIDYSPLTGSWADAEDTEGVNTDEERSCS